MIRLQKREILTDGLIFVYELSKYKILETDTKKFVVFQITDTTAVYVGLIVRLDKFKLSIKFYDSIEQKNKIIQLNALKLIII